MELASQVLGSMPAASVPAPLRGIARFDPRKRAKLGSAPIAAQLETDKKFRELVAEAVTAGWPELAESLAEGSVPPAAEPVLVAAAAYLTRPPGWVGMVETARADLERSAVVAEGTAQEQLLARLREQLAAQKAAAKEEADRLREQLKSSRSEISDLRRRLHDARERARAAEARAAEVQAEAEEAKAAVLSAGNTADGELRRLRERLADTERQLEATRRAAREGRSVEDTKVRMLLDVLQDAAAGLRRELALPPSIHRPADSVTSVVPGGQGVQAVPARALADDDPALLDQLLALPQIHLIVDGYNVTKTGYGTLTLADQRNRLLTGLGGLYAQTRTELTCVFDGAELNGPVPVSAPRGVRVLFSSPGQIADDLIRQLVRAEPQGRAVAVVSSDREVAESVRRMGARPVPSMLLLRRLGRG
ncbi:putative RNA-binding protein with PIN domain [Streptosporangium becharense]|uniref:Putative RNA-binding protein with PIN domain n=1 Tax=Streptosporangium becharense TaxID=1816182 RepID=A0A7W9ID24_9ACTN|nr:NYN domain-containing protein [Streptosporangium becharense]MBB2911885.1 putative RNA-binding protein with PIN domain [Streptosporangium becharense]MBB5818432.1 putative RNA-binding protein with PIN domain [Streptosporangium becharense]